MLTLLPRRQALEPAVRAAIRRLFTGWLAWLHASGIIEVTWSGFDGPLPSRARSTSPTIPRIVDATLILARLPDAVCIFKPSLMRNPAIGPAARHGGLCARATRGST